MRSLQRLSVTLQNSVFCCILFLLPAFVSAQKTTTTATGDNWKLNTTVDGVQLYYRIAACGSQKVVLLKFNNTNSKQVTIAWDEIFDVKGTGGVIKRKGLAKKQLLLPPGKTEQIDCQTDLPKGMVARPIQETPVNTEDVIDFRFTNVSVKK